MLINLLRNLGEWAPLLLLALAVLSAIPAYQARRRGYPFWVWFPAGMLMINPVYLLIVLAAAPHRQRQRLRDQFRQELDAKFAAAGAPAVLPKARPVPERSLGDLPTQLPGAAADTDSAPARSLGDEPTRL